MKGMKGAPYDSVPKLFLCIASLLNAPSLNIFIDFYHKRVKITLVIIIDNDSHYQ